MTDRWKEPAEKYNPVMPSGKYTLDDLITATFQAGAAHGYEVGRAEALDEAAQICVEQREAYHEDIFPDYTLKKNPTPSIDAVSGKMGRFLCDVLAREIRALSKKESAK